MDFNVPLSATTIPSAVASNFRGRSIVQLSPTLTSLAGNSIPMNPILVRGSIFIVPVISGSPKIFKFRVCPLALTCCSVLTSLSLAIVESASNPGISPSDSILTSLTVDEVLNQPSTSVRTLSSDFVATFWVMVASIAPLISEVDVVVLSTIYDVFGWKFSRKSVVGAEADW